VSLPNTLLIVGGVTSGVTVMIAWALLVTAPGIETTAR
jgi:hypothetical protein